MQTQDTAATRRTDAKPPAKKAAEGAGTARKPRKKKLKTGIEILEAARDGKAAQPLYVVNAYAVEDYLDLLKDVGINTDKMIEFEGNDAFVLTKDELTALLAKNVVFVTKRSLSQVWNVEWMWLQAIPHDMPQSALDHVGTPSIEAQSSVTVGEFHSEDMTTGKKYFGYIASILHRALKRPIELSVPHGETARYRPDGAFQIYIWSSPEGNKERHDGRDPPGRIWGYDTHCRDAAFVPSAGRDLEQFGGVEPFGVQICDGTYVVAELFPNALYVHHDLVHYVRTSELKVFAELLHRCLPYLTGPNAFAEYQAKAAALRLEAERNAFTNLVEASVAKRADRNKHMLEAAERVAATKRQEYFEAERQVFAMRQIALDPETAKQLFLAEFEKLRSGAVHLVTGVTFDPKEPEWVTVHTGEIQVEHPRTHKMHLIGKCDVSFNLEDGALKIVNKDRTYDDGGYTCHTPHVFHEGGTRVCLGNIREELIAYIAHYELEAATALTIAFLQSVSEGGDYVHRLEKFPIVENAAKPH